MIYQSLQIFTLEEKKKKKRSEILKTRFPRFPHIFTNGSLTSSLNEIIPPRSKHYSAISQFVSPFLEFSLNRRIRLRDRAQDSRLTKVTNMQNVVSSRSVVDDLVEMMFVVRCSDGKFGDALEIKILERTKGWKHTCSMIKRESFFSPPHVE